MTTLKTAAKETSLRQTRKKSWCCVFLLNFLIFLYRDEDTKAPDSFIKRRFTSPKSGIISSFLEDCLSVDSDKPKAVRYIFF